MNILKNRKLNIEIQNGEVVIKTPNYLSKEDLKYIASRTKESLIAQFQEYKEQREKLYTRTEVVQIFGKDCKVKINYKNMKKPSLIVEGKNIKIFLPNKFKKMGKEEIVAKLIDKLYIMIAEKEIEMILEKYRILLGIAPEDYKFENMGNFMAKCSDKKVLIINPEIIKYEKEIINYILLHQLCHLKHKTHSKSFYNMLKEYLPNYEYYESKLKSIQY